MTERTATVVMCRPDVHVHDAYDHWDNRCPYRITVESSGLRFEGLGFDLVGLFRFHVLST